MSTIANAEMAAAWDGPEGEHWTEHAERYDSTARGHWREFLRAVPIQDHDAVLDIGCGTGVTTRDAARLATHGSALGIDLSAQMLGYARERAAAEGLTNIGFEQADAQVHPFRPDAFTLAISKFGAMFFADPTAAFSNISQALQPGGRLAMLAWRELARNEWLTAIREALALGRTLPEPPLGAPGPFGLADTDHVRRVLGQAGYLDVAFHEIDEPMDFGDDTEAAFTFVSTFGITKGLTHDLNQAQNTQAFDALHRTLDDHRTDHGIQFGSSAWLITAVAGDDTTLPRNP